MRRVAQFAVVRVDPRLLPPYMERSIKYGVLFLVLVFTAFFLFEVTARQKIYPFQYLMVGAALCLFYLLLLSISEFIGFS